MRFSSEKIGGLLKSGQKHDGRAPDYDDWELNGDIILWNDVLERAFEISSMGIRVDEKAMDRQLKEAGADDRRSMEFHRMIFGQTVAIYHRWRYRAEQALYVLPAKSSYRRGPGIHMA